MSPLYQIYCKVNTVLLNFGQECAKKSSRPPKKRAANRHTLNFTIDMVSEDKFSGREALNPSILIHVEKIHLDFRRPTGGGAIFGFLQAAYARKPLGVASFYICKMPR
jgi:hypothetical protein